MVRIWSLRGLDCWWVVMFHLFETWPFDIGIKIAREYVVLFWFMYVLCLRSDWFCRLTRTPSTAFWHLPPNSARFSYTTEGAFSISMQLFSDAVSALRKVLVLMWLEATYHQSTHLNMRCIHPGYKKKEFHLDSNDCGFICAGVNFVGGYKWHA